MAQLTKLISGLKDQELWVDLAEVMKVDRKNLPNKSVIIQTDELEYTRLTFFNNQQAACMDHPDDLIPLINEAKAKK